MAITTAFIMMGGFFMVGLYVAGALGVLSLVIMYFFSDAPLWNIMGNKAWETNTNFILIAIPLFLMMGEFMLRSGMGEKMYSAVSRWIAFMPGGLIHTNIASCAIFAACSGSSVATSATISRVALPVFRQRGYSERLVIGSLAAGGTLGILIPPSIGLIVYGVLVEESIGRLYLAGFIPGFMLAAMMMLMIVGASLVFPSIAPKEPRVSWRLKFIGLISMIPIALIIMVVLGSIYAGWATPTEAAAFGVTGAFVLAVINNSGPAVTGWVVQKFGGSVPQTGLMGRIQERYPLVEGQLRQSMTVNWDMLKDAILSTVRTSSMIMLIVVSAFTLSFAFARLGISHDISQWIIGMDLSGTQLVIVLVIFYLLLGTFMESFAMLVTTVPILAPALVATGVDLVWFGIIMVILVEAALISPPEGINLYVLHGVRRDVQAEMAEASGMSEQVGTITDVYIGVLPFMAVMAAMIVMLIIFPDIALWLPNLVKGAR
ncbi:MAG: TRAP transporter large permease [Chloroflexi bacterium]|nr:TRAP transporter large permease [Chloroflexota bacterium]